MIVSNGSYVCIVDEKVRCPMYRTPILSGMTNAPACVSDGQDSNQWTN